MQHNLNQEPPQMHSQYAERAGVPGSHERPPSAQANMGQYQQGSHGPEEHNLLRRNLLGQDPTREDSRREYSAPKKDEYGGQMRSGYRGQYYNQTPTSIPVAEAPRSHPQPFEAGRRPTDSVAPEQMPIYGRPSFEHVRREENSIGGAEIRSMGGEPLSRRPSGEEMQQSRSFLGISSDPNKRGRASPLPQAMKGVQAPYVGPGSDPSIKSEFGRIFQGLGSGLGGLGNMTPSRQSPAPQRIRDDPNDPDAHKMVRVGSMNGRGRKPDEIDDGRRTPLGSGGRGGRKTKQT
jgi:hypothetical protein